MKKKSKATVPISVRIPLDQFNEIEKREINMADFLREKIMSELFSEKKILEEIKEHENKIIHLKSLLKESKNSKDKKINLEKTAGKTREEIIKEIKKNRQRQIENKQKGKRYENFFTTIEEEADGRMRLNK